MSTENIHYQIMKRYLYRIGTEIEHLVSVSTSQPCDFSEAHRLIKRLADGLCQMREDWDTCILFLDLGEEEEIEVSL